MLNSTILEGSCEQTNNIEASNTNNYPQRPPKRRKRIIVALTGATGAILGINTLIALRRLNIETHLIVSKWAYSTLKYETDYTRSSLHALADHVYSSHDMAAPIASGSFRVDGMVIVPCSMKTLAAIAAGYCDDLISRAADVMLKERHRLVLVARECPLSGIHLQNMLTVNQNGGIIFPPVPAYYTRPSSIEDLVDHTVGRVLDLFGFDTEEFVRWNGFEKE
jgi:phenylacrylic acid decarboxylase